MKGNQSCQTKTAAQYTPLTTEEIRPLVLSIFHLYDYAKDVVEAWQALQGHPNEILDTMIEDVVEQCLLVQHHYEKTRESHDFS